MEKNQRQDKYFSDGIFKSKYRSTLKDAYNGHLNIQ